MNSGWIFVLGFALLFVLGAVIGKRLPPEYRSRLGPTAQTVAMVWVFYVLHFTLVVLAAVESTWHFSLPAPLALGGGIGLVAVVAALYLSGAYAFRSLKRMSGLDTTRLVTEGIYQWSHPQIVGWAFVLGGLGLARGSAMVLLLALVF